MDLMLDQLLLQLSRRSRHESASRPPASSTRSGPDVSRDRGGRALLHAALFLRQPRRQRRVCAHRRALRDEGARRPFSAVESASIWMMYMTAYFPVVELSQRGPGDEPSSRPARREPREWRRWRSAACATRTMIATTRFEHNREFLEAAGAEHVFVDDGGDLAELLCAT